VWKVTTPCGHSADFSRVDGLPEVKFPLREFVGSLLYVATMCRPDISFATQRVARHTARPTAPVVKAAKRILEYLASTRDEGLVYTPKNEESFRALYSEVAKAGGQTGDLGDTVAFGDADFAACTVTMKSTSGSIIYHRGVPVAWKSQRQSVTATGTCEAEYVAMYDTLKLSMQQGYLDFFVEFGELPLQFVNNQSALALSKQTLTDKMRNISIFAITS